ncbi:PF13274 family protein [Leptospira noguchii str. 2006001870]|nr:type II toxin-antitoxin system antitoxin SocA domain-containing protein [Leptospira noguchii]EKR71319.1 PF13274 family protein [Leptospira noguchii str. 2006001870]UOG59898.1 SocA family protein [Leptospira noguchii]
MNVLESLSILYAHDVAELSKTKWNKLLFFMDGAIASLTDSNLGITDLQYVKLPYGPVLDGYKQKLQDLVENKILKMDRFPAVSDSSVFLYPIPNTDLKQEADFWLSDQSAETKIIYQKIVSYFGPHNAVQLSNFSHKLDAWRKPEMFSTIQLNSLSKDSFLKEKVGNENFGKWILTVNGK